MRSLIHSLEEFIPFGVPQTVPPSIQHIHLDMFFLQTEQCPLIRLLRLNRDRDPSIIVYVCLSCPKPGFGDNELYVPDIVHRARGVRIVTVTSHDRAVFVGKSKINGRGLESVAETGMVSRVSVIMQENERQSHFHGHRDRKSACT